MIYLEEKHRTIIKDILSAYPYTFYAFGSRVKGTHKEFSDLDLCYKDPIPLSTLSTIREAFEESNLPFTVDLINWNHCSDNFKKLVEPYLERFE